MPACTAPAHCRGHISANPPCSPTVPPHPPSRRPSTLVGTPTVERRELLCPSQGRWARPGRSPGRVKLKCRWGSAMKGCRARGLPTACRIGPRPKGPKRGGGGMWLGSPFRRGRRAGRGHSRCAPRPSATSAALFARAHSVAGCAEQGERGGSEGQQSGAHPRQPWLRALASSHDSAGWVPGLSLRPRAPEHSPS